MTAVNHSRSALASLPLLFLPLCPPVLRNTSIPSSLTQFAAAEKQKRHSFSSAYLAPSRGGIRLSKVVQTTISPATFSSSSWGIPLRPDTIIAPLSFGSTLGSPISWKCPEKPPRLPKPPLLTLFDEKAQCLTSSPYI